MTPDTAEIRPARNGPTLRQTSAERRRGSTGPDRGAADCARSGVAASGTAQSTRRDGARIVESDEGDYLKVSRQPRIRTNTPFLYSANLFVAAPGTRARPRPSLLPSAAPPPSWPAPAMSRSSLRLPMAERVRPA